MAIKRTSAYYLNIFAIFFSNFIIYSRRFLVLYQKSLILKKKKKVMCDISRLMHSIRLDARLAFSSPIITRNLSRQNQSQKQAYILTQVIELCELIKYCYNALCWIHFPLVPIEINRSFYWFRIKINYRKATRNILIAMNQQLKCVRTHNNWIVSYAWKPSNCLTVFFSFVLPSFTLQWSRWSGMNKKTVNRIDKNLCRKNVNANVVLAVIKSKNMSLASAWMLREQLQTAYCIAHTEYTCMAACIFFLLSLCFYPPASIYEIATYIEQCCIIECVLVFVKLNHQATVHFKSSKSGNSFFVCNKIHTQKPAAFNGSSSMALNTTYNVQCRFVIYYYWVYMVCGGDGTHHIFWLFTSAIGNCTFRCPLTKSKDKWRK